MVDATEADTIDTSQGSAATPGSFASEADRIAGRYEILGLLGAGGMGNVYRVRDLELDEIVALKFLRQDLLSSAGALERFRSEAKLARRVTHANVARTFDIGEHAGAKFLTMEFIDGPSLRALLAKEAAFSPARVIDIALTLCDALAAAHEAGVIHRDLKPDNVMIDRSGRVVVTDFGIACARNEVGQASGFVGTAAYMAPEQVEGREEVDGRTDIYALGAMLHELLAGRPPWRGASVMEIIVARLGAPPPNVADEAEVPPALATAIRRCLATQPEDRFANVAELAEALRAARDELVPGEASRTGKRAASAGLDVGAASKLVAVLPFANAGSSEDEHLADDLTDDLIDALSSAPGLGVRPRRVVARELARMVDGEDVGRTLGVEVIVEGTLRRRAGLVRVNARALSVDEGLQLWAQRFERPAHEILAINDEVARAVAKALCSDRKAEARPVPSNPAVVDLYLRARRALRTAWAGLGDLDEAVALFEAGIALAPRDVEMLSGLAMARVRRLNYADHSETGVSEVLELAARAVAAAPQLAEPWLAMATVHYTTSEWPAAARSLCTALERAPGLQQAHEMLAAIEIEVGCVDRGMARLERIISLDPGAWLARANLARARVLLGHDDGIDVLYPDLPLPSPLVPEELPIYRVRQLMLCRCSSYRGRLAADCAVPPSARELAADAYLTWKTFSSAQDGILLPAAIERLDRLLAVTRPGSRFRPVLLQAVAEVYGILGDHRRQIDLIGRAIDAQLYDLLWLDRCPLLAGARLEPEFAQLRARVEARAAAVRAALELP